MPGPCLPVPGENENHCLKSLRYFDYNFALVLMMNLIMLSEIKLKQRNVERLFSALCYGNAN